MKRSYTEQDISRTYRVALEDVKQWVAEGALKSFRSPGGEALVEHDVLLHFLRERGLLDPGTEADMKQKKILIVDDEADFLDVISIYVSKNYPDYIVETVHRPGRVLERIRTFVPDIVIMDLNMPEINGVELTRTIKSQESTGNIRVIAITGHVNNATAVRKAQEFGAECVVSKPIDFGFLMAQIGKER